MSKAFTKETDENLELVRPIESSLVPEGGQNYFTRTGLEKFKDEFKVLTQSSDFNETRVAYLKCRIDTAVVIESYDQADGRILFGAEVTLVNELNHTSVYQIVGIDEANPVKHKISWISPLAKALFNLRVGDEVMHSTAHGKEELRVLKITYPH